MPKVQITLEVADSGATAKLKDYGRAAADAFAQVKAGDPALKSATLRVQELTTAKGKATTVSNEWTGALQLIPGPLGQITSQAQTLTSALAGPGGLVVGIGAVVAAGFLLTKSLANDIERLDNLSRQTGLSVASLQAFEEAAKRAGESPETLTQGLGKVNAAISDVLMGTANAGKAFQAIGVDLRGMVRDGASAEDILEATAKALAAIEDPTRRAAAQMELFGIRGRSMSTVLDSLATKGLRGYTGEMEKAGVVTSEETNKMARAFDAMFDDVLTQARGFWVQMKAYSADWILNTRSDLDSFTTKATAALLMTTAAIMQFRAKIGATSQADADAASRSAQAALDTLMAASRAAQAGAPALERPPPQDRRRTLGATPEELALAKQAQALELKQFIEAQEDMRKAREELGAALAAIDDRDRAARLAGEQNTRTAVAAIWIQGVDDYEARQNERQAIDTKRRADAVAQEQQARAEIEAVGLAHVEHLNQVARQEAAIVATTSSARIQALEQERDKIRELLDKGVTDVKETEDLKLRITELSIARDLELEARKVDRRLEIEIQAQHRMNVLIEQRVTAERRANEAILKGQILTAEESGNAWAAFSAGFELETIKWGTSMEGFAKLGAEVAQTLQTAFSDFGVALVQNFDNIGDAWQGLLDSMIRMIIDFLAAEAVKQLLSLGTDIVKNISTSNTSPSSSTSGFDIFSPSTWFAQEKAITEESGKRLSFEQARTEESTRQLKIEEARNPGGRAGAAAGRGVGGFVGGGIGGAAGAGLGPVGALLGALGGAAAGREAFSRLGELLGDLVGDLLGLKDPVTQLGMTAAELAAASQVAAQSSAQAALAQTNFSGDLDILSGSTTTASLAAHDLAATQTDLAISQADLTSATQGTTEATNAAAEATNATTEGLAGFSDSVTGLGEGIAAAAEAAGGAAEVAGAAAASAAASAERAASAASDAQEAGGRNPGFGPGSDFQGGGRGSPDTTNPSSPSFGGGTGTTGGGGFANAFQSGLLEGPVRRSGFARVHRGEVVATPNQAAAILQALQGASADGPQTVALLKKMVTVMERSTRVGGRLVGDVF